MELRILTNIRVEDCGMLRGRHVPLLAFTLTAGGSASLSSSSRSETQLSESASYVARDGCWWLVSSIFN